MCVWQWRGRQVSCQLIQNISLALRAITNKLANVNYTDGKNLSKEFQFLSTFSLSSIYAFDEKHLNSFQPMSSFSFSLRNRHPSPRRTGQSGLVRFVTPVSRCRDPTDWGCSSGIFGRVGTVRNSDTVELLCRMRGAGCRFRGERGAALGRSRI
jgi:hypothetical protein